MLKRWAIKAAMRYLDRYFHKWLLKQEDKQDIDNQLADFQMYLRNLKSKTAFYVANLLDDWRE